MRRAISKVGLLLGGGFFALAVIAWIWHLYSSASNAANSGETGIVMLLFTFPWFALVETDSEAMMWIMVGFNALLLYVFVLLVGRIVGAIRRVRLRARVP
jgi:hypothetical protein